MFGLRAELSCLYLTTRGQSNTHHIHIRLYLTCRITQEVTDVRNDFTERQTLRSKPADTTNTWTSCRTRQTKTHVHILNSSLTRWWLRWDRGRVLLWSCCSYAWSLPSFSPTHTACTTISSKEFTESISSGFIVEVNTRFFDLWWKVWSSAGSSVWTTQRFEWFLISPVGSQPGPWSSVKVLGPGLGLGPLRLLSDQWGSAELKHRDSNRFQICSCLYKVHKLMHKFYLCWIIGQIKKKLSRTLNTCLNTDLFRVWALFSPTVIKNKYQLEFFCFFTFYLNNKRNWNETAHLSQPESWISPAVGWPEPTGCPSPVKPPEKQK